MAPLKFKALHRNSIFAMENFSSFPSGSSNFQQLPLPMRFMCKLLVYVFNTLPCGNYMRAATIQGAAIK